MASLAKQALKGIASLVDRKPIRQIDDLKNLDDYSKQSYNELSKNHVWLQEQIEANKQILDLYKGFGAEGTPAWQRIKDYVDALEEFQQEKTFMLKHPRLQSKKDALLDLNEQSKKANTDSIRLELIGRSSIAAYLAHDEFERIAKEHDNKFDRAKAMTKAYYDKVLEPNFGIAQLIDRYKNKQRWQPEIYE